ncbi:MAG: 1-acyl-sn-glycerol-3-phosphate acyltransferase [Alphaproteobacteria bacterium]|nr:1-acyl-sn-glycerol-3-phosphate acyltransferase [Alphaproteobacteria bacterium]
MLSNPPTRVARIRAGGALAGFLTSAILAIPFQWVALRLRLPIAKRVPWHFHRLVCRLCGIRVQVIGTPVKDTGVLIAANHTSWLDIPVIGSTRPLSFVAKREVGTWPLFSTLAKLSGSIFVDRSRRTKAVEQRDQVQERLAAGDAIVLFPEGTSSDGNRVLPFNSALLGAAQFKVKDQNGVYKDVPVQPVTVAYVRVQGLPMGREYRPFFAWYGDMELVPHLWEAFCLGPIDVVVEFHEPMRISELGGRKPLAQAAEKLIGDTLAAHLAGRLAHPPAAPAAPALPGRAAAE